MTDIARIGNTTKMGADIRESYYGGRTEVYTHLEGLVLNEPWRPVAFNKESDQPLNYYDVNSLYPAVMREKLMPLGNIFTEDNPKLSEVFGFCYAKIVAPSTLKRPILPFRLKGKIILATGSWTG